MTFNSLILIWFDKYRRKLPWREESDPYKIWLSEIILQQTRVAQGTAYYEQFCTSFPHLKDLANASEQEVLKLWQGLGYYSRARNLHYTAQYIYNNLNGTFPNNFKELLSLKGVGEYTAAAIASIAFGEAVPAIDGNAFRVYSRFFNIDLDISQPKTKSYFFNLGKEIIDTQRPGDFNQAVMELGATICLPKNPNCTSCPLQHKCEGLAKKRVHLLPVKTKKTKVRNRYFHFFEISDGKSYLIKKRNGKDVWKNLYNFPLLETEDGSDIKPLFKSILPTKVLEEKHLLSHQRLFISFWKLKVNSLELKELSNHFNAEIVSWKELVKLPLPRPMEKYIELK